MSQNLLNSGQVAGSLSNQLINGGFEIWQRGNGPFTASGVYTADRWRIGLNGTSTMSVSKDTTNTDPASGSRACAAVTYTHNVISFVFQSNIGDWPNDEFRNRTASVSIRVKTSTANAVRVRLFDGTTPANSSYHSGGGGYETLTATYTFPSAISNVQVAINFEASCTAYIDNAMLVFGATPVSYVPLPLAEEWARCERYYEVCFGQVANEMPLIGQASAATGGYAPWRFRVPKAVTPTITVVNQANWAAVNAGVSTAENWTGLNIIAASLLSATLNFGVAAGLVAGNVTMIQPTNTNAQLIAEANP